MGRRIPTFNPVDNEQVRPSSEVLNAFGLSGSVQAIAGGQGLSVVVDDVVLKPIENLAEADWSAELLSSISETGFRVERPIRTVEGRWTFDGWAAWSRLEGRHDTKANWAKALAVCDKFHHALTDVPKPDFMAERTNQWAVGDRVAWENEETSLPEQLSSLVKELEFRLEPLSIASQVIHGDMGGNILFGHGLPPAIIDFSPYFRPAGYASAIMAVDLLTWEGAKPSILRAAAYIDEFDQLLARAAIFRIVADALASPNDQDRLAKVESANRPVVDLILERIGRR